MGSACCVPAKAQRSESQAGWSSAAPGQQPQWRVNGNFSPPISSIWDEKATSDSMTHLYRCSFSSSSRRSRRGSSRCHKGSSGGHFSQDPSPSSSFRGSLNPLASSQICPVADLVPTISDSSSSSCLTISPTKEGCLSGALSTPESLYSQCGDYVTQPPPKQVISSSRSSSFKSKILHPLSGHQFAKNGPERQLSGLTSVGSRSPLSEDKHTGSVGAASDWWSMQTFSELVASSRQESLRWMSPGSPEEFTGLEGIDLTDFLALEKIRAGSSSTQPGSFSSSTEPFLCGLCSRWLSQKSPLSSQKMLSCNTDLPSVGVLSCGHVFHADCLEQATCEVEKQDPPCPQCAAAIKSKSQRSSEAVGFFRGCSSQGAAKNKLSRIGVVMDEADISFRGFSPSLPIFSPTEAAKGKSKRAFSFKGKHLSRKNSDASLDNKVVPSSRWGSLRYWRGW